MSNRLILATAGSGKTTYVVDEALKIPDEHVLITTFTLANEQVIKRKFIKAIGYVPNNITIQTWFSLLLQHGIKPYQSYVYDGKLNGIYLVNEKSGFRFRATSGFPIYWGEDNVAKHYLTKSKSVFSDKLSKFVIRCNERSNGKVIERLTNIFPHIFIDEVQDLAGYDLEIIKLLFKSLSSVTLVGDPRQVTYNTHFEDKYKKYRSGRIKEFLLEQCKSTAYTIDETTLKKSYRNLPEICELSSKLYPMFDVSTSANDSTTQHDGLFLITSSQLLDYLKTYDPVQLRLRSGTVGPIEEFSIFNFGDSKGLTLERVVIFPTNEMKRWLKDNTSSLADLTRAQLYVALTRAKHSVAFCFDDDPSEYQILTRWEPS